MLRPAVLSLLATLCGAAAWSAPATEPHAGDTPPPWVARLKGDHDLWQDGEGGLGCQVPLTGKRTIGGYELRTDRRCEDRLKLAGEPAAWFVRDDGVLVVVDATRQVLLRMRRLPDGSYKDPRAGDYVDAVLLTPARPRQRR